MTPEGLASKQYNRNDLLAIGYLVMGDALMLNPLLTNYLYRAVLIGSQVFSVDGMLRNLIVSVVISAVCLTG